VAEAMGKTGDNSGTVQAQMIPEQSELRSERLEIMIADGGCTEEEAHRYMDKYPIAYGRREVTEAQDELWR
jgi:hypothetical protein